MNQDKPFYSGFLLLPPTGKLLIKKSWQQKYCLLFKSSKFGIERLEIYDNTEALQSTPSKIITLENCIKVISRMPTYFSITTKTSIYEFGTLNQKSLTEWLNAIQSVAFPDDASKLTSLEEDNDLYCPSGEAIFNVMLHESSASLKCGLEPKMYILILTEDSIELRNYNDNKLLFVWPYLFIRRYGYKHGKFTFEAGRKCQSGEGIFYLEHSNRQEIFRCLESKMKSMKKRLNNKESFSILDCAENQFHAALNMEARTRSPLPPSPTTSTSLHDIDSNITSKSHLTFTESIENKLRSINKPIPLKPPRKTIPCKPVQQSMVKPPPDYELIDKYDKVEYRSDAWKTLGLDNVKHSENINEEHLEEDYLSWGHQKRKNIKPVTLQAPKIITEPFGSNSDDSYDKLNFFGSCSKLDMQSAYKQVNVGTSNTSLCSPSFNDYDEVQPILEGVRIADDSHLGYALIRKDTPKPKEEILTHQFHNDEPYAIISKPKRV